MIGERRTSVKRKFVGVGLGINRGLWGYYPYYLILCVEK